MSETSETQNLRLVSLLPSATEIICALGLEASLVGVTHECDFPPSVKSKPHLTQSHISHEKMSSAEIDLAVRSQLGANATGADSIYMLDEKLLQELQPDLIFTQELCTVCAVSFEEVKQAARLCSADTRVVSLEPCTIKEIFENILLVGELCGVAERAKTFVRGLQKRLEIVETNTKNVPRRRTLMLEWLEPFFAPGHWVLEQALIAGGDDSFGHLGKPSTQATIEAIAEYAPEKIVLIPCGFYIPDIIRQLSQIKFPEDWFKLPAVKSREIWAVDASAYFSRPGPRVVEGVEILARILHPNIFGAPTEKQAVRIAHKVR